MPRTSDVATSTMPPISTPLIETLFIISSSRSRALSSCAFRFLPFGDPGAAGYFFIGEHRPAALRRAAVAVGVVLVRVVEVVLVDQLLGGGDVADRPDEDALADFYRLAVGRAGVVEEHRGAEAVDDVALPAEAEEVGDVAVGVTVVGFFFGQPGPVVLDDAGAAADGVERVAAGGVDGRGTDEEARGGSSGRHRWG